jgi:hypothetical protein
MLHEEGVPRYYTKERVREDERFFQPERENQVFPFFVRGAEDRSFL